MPVAVSSGTLDLARSTTLVDLDLANGTLTGYAGGVERLLAWAAGKPIDVMNPEALQRKKA
jgi:hypothetical protein